MDRITAGFLKDLDPSPDLAGARGVVMRMDPPTGLSRLMADESST